MITVSAIIPTYNRAAYIAESIRSALTQERPPKEIIVVDDGSTDRTRDELAAFIRQGQIRYIHQSNAGVSAARNTGIRESSGDFVAFLDSDDRWLPRHLRQLTQALECHHEVKMAFSGFEFFSTGGRSDSSDKSASFHRSLTLMLEHGFTKGVDQLWLSNASFLSALFEVGFTFRVQGTLIERELLLHHGLSFDEALSFTEDAQFINEAALFTPALFVPDIGLEVRRHDENRQDHGYHRDTVVKSYERRIARSKEIFKNGLTKRERRSFTHALWDLQRTIMNYRGRDRSYGFRVKEGLVLLRTVPCWTSVKSFIKVLMGREEP